MTTNENSFRFVSYNFKHVI